jgi:hypothetical protein
MEPELILTASQIDYDIATMCGETPGDYLVLCFDGKPFDGFGTPKDCPAARTNFRNAVVALNDRSPLACWPDFLGSWSPQIEEAFGISGAELEHFRPDVSYRIHRVVAARSKYLHAAITLFEDMREKILVWQVAQHLPGQYRVEIIAKDPWISCKVEGCDLPLAICKAMLRSFGKDGQPAKGGAE